MDAPTTRRRPRTMLRPRLFAGLAALALGASTFLPHALDGAPSTDLVLTAATANPVTPGDFTGYGFDQCHTPSQKAMDVWWTSSPFTAVGVYLSGNSRACRDQPNLTSTWVSTQLKRGWRILPITLGPQASCQPRFPRYDDDPTINPKPGASGRYPKAAAQGVAEAKSAVAAAQRIGIVSGSTLWYDLEGFDVTRTACRESALRFLSSWTEQLHELGYVSGVYSSAGSGIKMLDDARVERPDAFTLPDAIWIARWDGVANTSTSYIRNDGWRPGGRVKQYQGGHDETWGGVTINIDRNFLQLGRGSRAPQPPEHCGGTDLDLADFPAVRPSTTAADGTVTAADPALVSALQCRLSEAGLYNGRINGSYNARTQAAAAQWQEQAERPMKATFGRRDWMTLLGAGKVRVLKFGSVGEDVRRIQRALNAVSSQSQLRVTGVFGVSTEAAVKAYQDRLDLPQGGVLDAATWAALQQGLRS